MRALAGLVAGTAVSLAAVSDAPGEPAIVAAAAVASAATTTTALAAPADNSAWSMGSLRLAEAAAELEYRQGLIAAASRSDQRPTLSWPAKGSLSGWFGERRGRRGHLGVDVDGDTGDPVTASGAGVVEWAGWAPDGYAGYGKMVLIRHSGGVQTLYAHLSRIAVAVGSVVDAGDYIGAMGTTGNVTGSHLHFEVRYGGVPVNPRHWLPGG